MEQEKKVNLLVYATENKRAHIKTAAAKPRMSRLILDSVSEQAASIEELEKNGGAQA